MSTVDTSHLQALGSSKTNYQFTQVTPELLESFASPFSQERVLPNRSGQSVGSVKIRAPEFTSLCPLTGQPDFATIVIEYVPRNLCVESKALKLYLNSFRNVGEFHESCVERISRDLVTLLDPRWMLVRGEFTPRGGIPFWPEVVYTATERA